VKHTNGLFVIYGLKSIFSFGHVNPYFKTGSISLSIEWYSLLNNLQLRTYFAGGKSFKSNSLAYLSILAILFINLSSFVIKSSLNVISKNDFYFILLCFRKSFFILCSLSLFIESLLSYSYWFPPSLVYFWSLSKKVNPSSYVWNFWSALFGEISFDGETSSP